MTRMTGARELITQLRHLADVAVPRVSTSGIAAVMPSIEAAIRSESPTGQTRETRRAVGSRFAKHRSGGHAAKIGVGVGKRRSRAPHAHLTVIGTRKRFTRRGAFRGQTRQNDWLMRGWRKQRAAAADLAVGVMAAAITREAEAL